jgi:uncharacterized protein (TIGR03437 family)
MGTRELLKGGALTTALLLLAVSFSLLPVQTGAPAEPPPPAEAAATVPTMRLSQDGRHLIGPDGNPVFIAGDAGWSLFVQPTLEDADLYLTDRAAKGFNLVLANLIDAKFASKAPRNIYGEAPFTRAGDFTTPNEAYFARADAVIRLAGQKGITILLDPIYLGWQCGDQGWCREVQAATNSQMRFWGRYLGSRYKDFPNIVWIIGGDANPFAYNVGDKLREMVAGIKEFDAAHLMTAHNDPGNSAQDIWGGDAWLDLNTVYQYGIETLLAMAREEAVRGGALPLFMLESAYEREHNSTPASLRYQAYGATLWGATLGSIFGNCPLWSFGFDDGWCAPTNWKGQLNSTGAVEFGVFASLMRSRKFWLLAPDYSHSVMTDGYGSGASLATTARASDGSTVISYIPTPRRVTMNLAAIKDSGGQVRCSWFNPRSGVTTVLGTYPDSGTQDFTPPDQNDWVLIMDAASAGSARPFTIVSAASFAPATPLAAGVIAAGFGEALSAATESAPPAGPLPTTLAQRSVVVRDNAGAEFPAPLWFVSPGQINFLVPEAVATGPATVSVVGPSETVAAGPLQLERTAPAIFTMNNDGRGVPAAIEVLDTPGEPQLRRYVFLPGCVPGACVPVPLDLGSETPQAVLEVYGTGIRNRLSLSSVTATIGGVDAAVEYAGPVAGMTGLDQVNIRIPRLVAGRGEVDLLLKVEGKSANVVLLNIK